MWVFGTCDGHPGKGNLGLLTGPSTLYCQLSAFAWGSSKASKFIKKKGGGTSVFGFGERKTMPTCCKSGGRCQKKTSARLGFNARSGNFVGKTSDPLQKRKQESLLKVGALRRKTVGALKETQGSACASPLQSFLQREKLVRIRGGKKILRPEPIAKQRKE